MYLLGLDVKCIGTKGSKRSYVLPNLPLPRFALNMNLTEDNLNPKP